MTTTNKTYFCCPECRSTHVQAQLWVDPNSDTIIDDTGNYSYCDQCDDDIKNGGFLDLPWNETREGKAGEPEPGEPREAI